MKRAAERVAKRRICFGKHTRMKRAAERVAKRRIYFWKHKGMKRAAERVAKRRACFWKHKGMKRADERVAKTYLFNNVSNNSHLGSIFAIFFFVFHGRVYIPLHRVSCLRLALPVPMLHISRLHHYIMLAISTGLFLLRF